MLDHDCVVETQAQAWAEVVRNPRDSQQAGVGLQRRGERTWS